MEQSLYVVIYDDVATDSGHFVPGDVLHMDAFEALVRETGGPITCAVCVGFGAACAWSEAQEQF